MRLPRPRSPDGPERAYSQALRALTRDLARTCLELVRPQYERAAPWRTDAALRVDAVDKIGIDWGRLRTMLGTVAVDRAKVLADAQARRVERWNREDMSRVLRIDFKGESDAVKRAMARARRENVALIKSIAIELHGDVRRVVRESTIAGNRVEDLTRDLRERFSVSESRAELIARDQTTKANAALTQVRHKEAGIERYMWSASRDERVRPMHAALDGRIFRYDEPPPVTNEAGERNMPGEDIQCRCVAVAILDY